MKTVEKTKLNRNKYRITKNDEMKQTRLQCNQNNSLLVKKMGDKIVNNIYNGCIEEDIELIRTY